MAHDVFISYSTKNKDITDEVCMALEAQGIKCWIAPRNIKPGADWRESIIDAIAGSRALLLIFSEPSNKSRHVKTEVQTALDDEIPILPFRIENVAISKNMRWCLCGAHWLDAMPLQKKHIDSLADTIRSLLNGSHEDPDEEQDDEVDEPSAPAIGITTNIDDYDVIELMTAIRQAFADCLPRNEDQAVRAVASHLSYRRVGPHIRKVLTRVLKTAVKRRILKIENKLLCQDTRSIDDYSRDELIEALRTVIGRQWWEREDAVRAAINHLGFRRYGPNIRQSFKSVINSAIRQKLIETDGSLIRKSA